MGLQSAVARAAGPGGIATTYMTGTLTNAVARAASALRRDGSPAGEPSGAPLPAALWVVYALAAAAGAFAEQAWHGSPVILAVCLAALATAAARRVRGG